MADIVQKYCAANLLNCISRKNYRNPSKFDKVITKSKVRLLSGHSVAYIRWAYILRA